MNNNNEVTIIGGGITGLCSAFFLQQTGWKVTVIDKGDYADNCSLGNAGMIVPSHFVPLAQPGIVQQGIKWMFNSRSPFYIKPQLSTHFFKWVIQFLKHANSRHVAANEKNLLEWHLQSSNLYKQISTQLNNGFELTGNGIVLLCKKEKTFEEEAHLAGHAQNLGLQVDVLGAAAAALLEPGIPLNIAGAVHYRCDSHLNPVKLMQALKKYLEEKEVTFIAETGVTDFTIANKSVTALHTTGGLVAVKKLVITGGAWQAKLAQKAGVKMLLMPGKGYSFFTDVFEHKLQHPALLIEDRVAITPMNGKVRVGGTMELAGMHNTINMKRVEGIVNAVGNYYTGYNVQLPAKKDIWYGYRPCSPDGLPYIGRPGSLTNVVFAGGMGMMGISLGPATGQAVAEILNEQKTTLPVTTFSPDRFS